MKLKLSIALNLLLLALVIYLGYFTHRLQEDMRKADSLLDRAGSLLIECGQALAAGEEQ